MKTVAETIANAAQRETTNKNGIVISKSHTNAINVVNKIGTSENFFTPGRVYNYLVSVDDEPITLQDFKRLKPNIRATHGFYTLQYIPSGSVKRNPKFPYLIGQDLVRIRITVSGPAHWNMMCKRIPELAWLKRNSTMSAELFAIAKKHPGLVLRFGIDFVKYCNKIESRAEELGVDIDHKPLVLYQWGANDVPQVDGVLEPVRDKKYYADVLAEINDSIQCEEDIISNNTCTCTRTDSTDKGCTEGTV